MNRIQCLIVTLFLIAFGLNTVHAADWCGYQKNSKIAWWGQNPQYSARQNQIDNARATCKLTGNSSTECAKTGNPYLCEQMRQWSTACGRASSSGAAANEVVYAGISNKLFCVRGHKCLTQPTPSNVICFSPAGEVDTASCGTAYTGPSAYYIGSICSTCLYGQTFNPDKGKCSCPDSQVLVNNVCAPCATGTTYDSATGACVVATSTPTCTAPATYNQTAAKCVCPDTTMEYVNNACKTITTPTTPVTPVCQPPQVLNTTTKLCQDCPSTAPQFVAPNACKACPPTAPLYKSGTNECGTCPTTTPKFVAPNSCEACPATEPLYIGGAANTCKACEAQTPIYNPSTNTCEACPITAPHYRNDIRACEACASGKPFYNRATNECEACTDPTHYNTDAMRCVLPNYEACLTNPAYNKGSRDATLTFLQAEVKRLNQSINILRRSGGYPKPALKIDLEAKAPCCKALNNGVACPAS